MEQFTGEAVYENTLSFLAKPGDVVIFNRNYGEGYGHVGIVISATYNSITILEQNWLVVLTDTTRSNYKTHTWLRLPMWFY